MKEINDDEKLDVFPTAIMAEGEYITSQKKIEENIARSFDKSIKEIQYEFADMAILRALRPEKSNKFRFSEVIPSDMYKS